jgi:drug/metabolite transporter (DMT)-like permease
MPRRPDALAGKSRLCPCCRILLRVPNPATPAPAAAAVNFDPDALQFTFDKRLGWGGFFVVVCLFLMVCFCLFGALHFLAPAFDGLLLSLKIVLPLLLFVCIIGLEVFSLHPRCLRRIGHHESFIFVYLWLFL